MKTPKSFKPWLAFYFLMLTCGIGLATQVSTPNLPLASPAAVQNGDLLVATRGGITQNVSWPPSSSSGSTTLGSSTTANPAISGDATSGFYSAGAGKVDVNILGANVSEWSSSGLGFIATSSAGTGFTGIHSPSANAIALSTTGTDRFIINAAGAITTGLWNATAVGVAYGGTGLGSTPTNGQILIGNGSGFTLGTITQGTNITITNSAGGITIASSAGGGSVNLGSITTANPQISGDTTSGFYSAGAAKVDVGISGVKVAEFGTGGTVLAGTTSVSNLTVTGTCTGCGGAGSLIGATTSSETALGVNALTNLTTGLDNVAIGFGAGGSMTIDGQNIAIGTSALGSQIAAVTTAGNIGIGYQAGAASVTANANTAVGYQALNANVDSTQTAFGYQALKNTTSQLGHSNTSTAVGYQALRGQTIGYGNTAVGTSSGSGVTTGHDNTVMGSQAGQQIGTASQNTIFGSGACNVAGMGGTNVCIGDAVGNAVFTGSGAVLIGSTATTQIGSTNLTIIGQAAKGGSSDTLVGQGAGAASAINGNQASGLGRGVLAALTSGNGNTALGYQAGNKITSGANNLILGYQVATTTLTIGSNNVLIGTSSAIGVTTSSTTDTINLNGIYTVTGTSTPSTAANTINGTLTMPNIGSDATHTTATVCEDTTSHTFFAGSGTLGVCLGTSSARYKDDIRVLPLALTDVMKLKPVQFHYKKGYGDPDKLQRGLLAEDLAEVFPDLVGRDKTGEPNSVDYGGLPILLLKAVQEQENEIQSLSGGTVTIRQDESTKNFLTFLTVGLLLQSFFVFLLWRRK